MDPVKKPVFGICVGIMFLVGVCLCVAAELAPNGHDEWFGTGGSHIVCPGGHDKAVTCVAGARLFVCIKSWSDGHWRHDCALSPRAPAEATDISRP